MNYYVRATGDNRYTGQGTSRWLKIRNIKLYGMGYALEVRIRGRQMFVGIRKDEPTENLEFGMGSWPNIQPVSHIRVIEGMK